MKRMSLASLPQTKIATAYLLLTKNFETATELIRAWLASWQVSELDQIWLASPETISIREIRDFERQLLLAPLVSPRRIGVISTAQNLSTDANQALLKFLEDPPEHVTTFLVAAHEDQLLPTIVSRCQRWRLSADHQDQTTRQSLLKLTEIQKMTIRDRFSLAENWAKAETFLRDFDHLLVEAQAAFRNGSFSVAGIEQLLKYRALAETNTNSRLLAETTLLNLG